MGEEINQLVEAMNAHDLDAVVQLFHSDYHSEQPAHPAREFGTSAQVRANWDAMFRGIPDFRAELVRSADDGHTCWTEWHWWGNRTDGPEAGGRGTTLGAQLGTKTARASAPLLATVRLGTSISPAGDGQDQGLFAHAGARCRPTS